MKLLIQLLIFGLALAGCVSNASTAEQPEQAAATQKENAPENGLNTISSSQAKALLEKNPTVVILDVHTPEEFAKGHLKNAVLLNKNASDFETRIAGLDKNKTYLVYCAVGGRSGQATAYMKSLGFKNLYDATEGFASLKSAAVPVE